MISIETLLPADELAQFQTLIKEATAANAGAISWHSQSSAVLVVAVIQSGEVLTWFASPAHNEAEALAVKSTIVAGLNLAIRTMQEITSGPLAVANQAIKKAQMH